MESSKGEVRVLVLGGGSVRGAYEAGAMKAILDSGYEPNIITTISVGSINGMFLLNLAGKQKLLYPNKPIDYKKIGQDIWDLWTTEINNPSDIVKKRNFFVLAWSILTRRFNGFMDNKPLKDLVAKHIEHRFLNSAPIDIYSGTVDINNAKIVYADKTYPDYIDFAIASTSIPMAMPVSIIKHKPYCDGGLIDSAPLKLAFDKGATEIMCIANSPEHIGVMDVDTGRPVKYIERVLDLLLTNSLNNDIREAELINSIAPDDGTKIKIGFHAGKKRIPLTVIRPDSPINVDITDFDSDDIKNMLQLGYENAKKIVTLKN